MNKTILRNDSMSTWKVPVDWHTTKEIVPNGMLEVDVQEWGLWEPYSEVRRYFTAEQLYHGERSGIWDYSLDIKKRRGFAWDIDGDGRYDLVIMNNGDFEVEIFDFGVHGRICAPKGLKVVWRNIAINSWLREIKEVVVEKQKKVVVEWDVNGVPDRFQLIPQVFYHKRSREEIKKINKEYLEWKRENLIISTG